MADAPVIDAAPPAPLLPKWVPTIIQHIFWPDSRKVGFGWWLFILASYATFFAKILDANTWLICTAFSSALIGGGTLADAKNDLERAKLDAAK